MFMLSCFVVSAQALFAEEAEETYWTYQIDYTHTDGKTYGYITDNHNIWKLVATGKGNNLTVGTFAQTPSKHMTFTAEFLREDTKVYPIDFSRKIYNEDKSKTFIVTSFGYFSSKTPSAGGYKDRLSEFIAPDCTFISGVSASSGYNFKQCTSLTNVVLNENLKDIPTEAFAGCTNLVNFYPCSFKACSQIRDAAFSGCKKLAGKFVFEACTTVYDSVFNGCEALEEVSMPAAVGISSYMFNACKSLKKVDMPSATSIGEYAFVGCEKLSELTVSPNLEEILSYAFKNCTSLPPDFVNLIAGKGLKRFGAKGFVFSGCTSLTSLIWNFPNLESKIVRESQFSGCSSLSKVVFKTPVDEIRAYAFYNIKEGAEIYLPKEVPQKFGEWAIGIRKNTKNNPVVAWPKAFVPNDTKDKWLEAMGQTCCYFKKEQFNVSDAKANGTPQTYHTMEVGWAHARAIMQLDTDMCTYDAESKKLILKDNRVIGFVFAKKNNSEERYGCWVLRAPESGFSVIVR
mgnify:FL=1